MGGPEPAHGARAGARLSAFAEYAEQQAAAWGAAPWQRIAEGNASMHDDLVDLLRPRAGESWLDVGTGTGAVAIRAAQGGAVVTGLDLAPNLIETARSLATEAGVDVTFGVGNAEALPYASGSFDVVSSAFGVIFAPDQRTAARELGRVLRSGGRLGLTALHPDSSAPRMFRHLWRYQPLPAGAGNPIAWGEERHLRGLLDPWFDVEVETVEAPPHREDDPQKTWEFLLGSMGLFKSVYESLEPERQVVFKEEYLALLRDSVPARRYVRILGTRR